MNHKSAVAVAAIDLLILVSRPPSPSAGDLSATLLSGSSIFILFGLLCVLCSETLGAFTGPVGRGGYVSNKTPAGCFVSFGNFLLLLPILIVIYRAFIANSGLLAIWVVRQCPWGLPLA